MKAPTLRRALDDDALKVAEVYIRARSAAVAFIPPYVHTDDEVREWIASILIPNQDTWVAVTEDCEIVAMMSLQNGWINQLYVDPKWNGQGIGSSMIELAKERCPNGLQLWTFESNMGARRFYKRHGFIEAERQEGNFNEEGAPAIRYQWKVLDLG